MRDAITAASEALPEIWTRRANILAMTRQAERAVIAPAAAGGFDSHWRAAVAARIARLNGRAELAAYYLAQAGDAAALASPDAKGRDEREVLVLGFMDRVAALPRDIAAEDIAALQEAGLPDADIVRLCELNAFLSYQCRLDAGLDAIAEAWA